MQDKRDQLSKLMKETDFPVCLADLASAARARLDPGVAAFFDGGAGDERTLRANAEAWQDMTLWPRVLKPLEGGHTRTTLAGCELAHPILVAPVAFQRLAHDQGEWASALAAAAQGAGYVLPTLSSVPMERVAEAVLPEPARGPLWFQLYWQADRGVNRALLQRAEAAGYEAVVLTVDAPVQGMRDAERRTGFRLPAGISAVHLSDGGRGTEAAHADAASFCAGVAASAPTWDDVLWLQAQTRLPVWLKGVLHPLDARQAQSLDVAGLIVSNHGGRTLDTAPATARALARIAETVGPALPLIVDGGIRRGTDVLKAVALGARAVMIGRPVVHALAVAGPVGVARLVRTLRDELEMAMALCGCRTLADATPALTSSP